MSEFIEIEYNDEQVIRALRRAPKIMGKHLNKGISNAAERVNKEERSQAPKGVSGLVNSIQTHIISPLERSVGPTVNYARAVEEGTSGGGTPPPVGNLLEWIRVKRITPRNPAMSDETLARVISKSIGRQGTPANPFRKRTVEKMRSRVFDMIRESTEAGIREAWK
ncbi:MAG: hypothetical protein ABFS45_06510 [Pseudomonadota bacterium]